MYEYVTPSLGSHYVSEVSLRAAGSTRDTETRKPDATSPI